MPSALCTIFRSFCISAADRGFTTRLVPAPLIWAAIKTAADRRLTPPGVCMRLLTVLLISYWLFVTFFRVRLLFSGELAVAAVFVSTGELATMPGAPLKFELV